MILLSLVATLFVLPFWRSLEFPRRTDSVGARLADRRRPRRRGAVHDLEGRNQQQAVDEQAARVGAESRCDGGRAGTRRSKRARSRGEDRSARGPGARSRRLTRDDDPRAACSLRWGFWPVARLRPAEGCGSIWASCWACAACALVRVHMMAGYCTPRHAMVLAWILTLAGGAGLAQLAPIVGRIVGEIRKAAAGLPPGSRRP